MKSKVASARLKKTGTLSWLVASSALAAAAGVSCGQNSTGGANGKGNSALPSTDASSTRTTDTGASSTDAQGSVADAGQPTGGGDAATSGTPEGGKGSDAAQGPTVDAGRSADGGDAATSNAPETGTGSDAAPSDAVVADTGVGPPLLLEEFQPSDFNGTKSTDGVWQIAGPWVGTGSNYLNPVNAQLVSAYGGSSAGFLLLSVVSTNNAFNGSCSGTADGTNPCQGAEIQTNGTTAIAGSAYNGSNLHYGYYEARIKVTNVPGVVVSFFWKEVNYGNGEIDYEWLTNESWATNPSANGVVHLTVQGGPSQPQNLTFNPTADFHRYGFLWTPSKVEYVVDGVPVLTYTNPPVTSIPDSKGGYIMMNTWTGNANWGGGPPQAKATSEYDWVKFWPDVTTVPAD